MTDKTAIIDVPIEVRKTGQDEYQCGYLNGGWSAARPESVWRAALSHGARAIVQAIDSGAFADPLPTAEGAHVYNPELKVHFFLTEGDDEVPWISSHALNGRYWHTPEQVQSYGPFEVLYDPEAQS